MHSKRSINVVAAHAEGEVGRVIVGGVLPPPGGSVREQRDWLQQDGDDLRKLLIREPRGGVFTHYNLIVPAHDPSCQAGFIIMEPMDYPPMSGSNSICVATVLLETGMLALESPTTKLKLETPGGPIDVHCECVPGKVRRVTTVNVPCYVHALDLSVTVEGFGELRFDVCYGGAFFALFQAADVGLSVVREHARELVEVGERLKTAVRERIHPEHPVLGDIGGVTFVTFLEAPHMQDDVKTAKNTTVVSPGKLDRSPCGTASSARLAAMAARGELQQGESLLSTSILDTEFLMRIESVAEVGNKSAIVPSISGRAWITGHHTFTLDPEDPFPQGYSVTDTAHQLF